MSQPNATFGGGGAHQGAMTPTFELGRDFYTVHQVSSSYVYSFGRYRVDKQTNKQTDAAENIQRYATTLGKDLIEQR